MDAAVGPVGRAGGRQPVPFRGSGGAVGKVSPTLEAVDRVFSADGCVVDTEEEGDVSRGRLANVGVPVQFGTFTDEAAAAYRGTPGANNRGDNEADYDSAASRTKAPKRLSRLARGVA